MMGRAAGVSEVPNFQLLDHQGVSRELHRQKHHKAVLLFVTGNGCPIARQSLPALKELQAEYGPQGVEVWLLNSNPQDDREAIRKEAVEFEHSFPVLVDAGQWVAQALGVTRTCEAILIGTSDWKVHYRGMVDDRLGYGAQKSQAERRPLTDALKEFVAGRPVAVARTEFKGCAITFPDRTATGEVTYTQHVAPLLQAHCVSCHSPGNIGPFAMTDYEKVKGWSSMIREVLLEQRMPPWPADPSIGHFKNPRSLTTDQTRKLLDWVDQGSPRGTGPDLLKDHPPAPPEPWPLGKPDVVVSMGTEMAVPATGIVPYQYFKVTSPIDRDVWVRAAVVKPGNTKVLHHALIFVKYPEHLKSIEPRQNGGTAGYFSGFVPGTAAVPFPEGTGKFLPKGTEIIFQMHYSPTGRPEKDRTELGLYLLPEKPQWELRTRAATQTELLIKPGQRDYKASASYTFKKAARLFSLSPHMHVRGSQFRYDLILPDGTKKPLLSVPRWDFAWQSLYQLKEPLEVPAGAQLVCSGAFDNSASNPANPDPKQWVIFGEQTQDEMFIGYYDIAVPPQEVAPAPKTTTASN